MNEYSVLKLSNGENLVCRVVNKTDSDIIIQSPLKMETINQITDSGISESLSLTRWLQPFCDVTDYTIQKHSIVISVPASVGLSRYYEYVLKKIDSLEIKKPTKSDIRKIQKSEVKNKLDKLKKDLAELEIDGETIH
tara:strand:+ start:43 stop:453 length:411 start_codon:yes stop_codon:yes gene_type:complete